MYTIRRKLTDAAPAYPLDQHFPLDKILFVDIETTGFTAKNSILYLIGCAYYENGSWNTIQWFATTYEKEKNIITAFFKFAENYQCLIHFNGNNFDLPFLLQKCRQFDLPYDFSKFTGIDIYKRISPFKKFLGLPNCKQKTLEQFLEIDRQDPFDGGQLISIYHEYVKKPTDYGFAAIVSHNYNDLLGMFQIIPLLSYGDIFSEQTKVKKVQANHYHDQNGANRQELYMKLSFPSPLPREISYSIKGCYFSGSERRGVIRVPIYDEEMKYFYSNYKDYYYLPIEDVAIHKSIASFVDKDHRQQAKASNCYTRKHSLYLPQWENLFEPFFKRNYEDRTLYFEITEELKKDRQAFRLYALHLLKMMGNA